MATKKHEVLGKIYKDRFGNEFIVESLDHRDKYGVAYYLCKFIVSGYTTTAPVSLIIGNEGRHVQDRFSPSVFGIGTLGNAYKKDNPKLFDVWRAMIARCYNPKNPSYKTYGNVGITICDRWKRFDLFLDDVINIKGYDKEKIDKGLLVLDKDTIDRNAKIYSIDTCSFITRSENTKESNIRRWEKQKMKV